MVESYQANMLETILYYTLSSIISHILYFILERIIQFPILTPLRQLGLEDLIREDLSQAPNGKRTAFTVNIMSIFMLFLHSSAMIVFPWYALAIGISGMLSTWRITYVAITCDTSRVAINKLHSWFDTFRLYFGLTQIGIGCITVVNAINPFKRWSIKINRVSAETYGFITIFGIAAGIYYIARKFYVKNPTNKLVPHAGKNSRNQAAINLGIMVLSFAAFSDFSLWKQFSDWIRFQSFASSVFGISTEESCKNFSEKIKKKGCSATELGPSLCHGCCALQAQSMATAHTQITKFDVDSVMANPPDYFSVLAKEVIRNPTEIPKWFLDLPHYVKQAIFDGYYANRSIADRTHILSLEDFLLKKYCAKYVPKTNSWTLSPTKLNRPPSDSESDSEFDYKEAGFRGPIPHGVDAPDLHEPAIEVDVAQVPKIDLGEEFPILKRAPSYLVSRVGFLVAMALLTYGIYLYNSKEEESKYVPPHRRTDEEHKIPSETYNRQESGVPEHRGKVTFRQQQSKFVKHANKRADTREDTSVVENSPVQWYHRFKSALSRYYMLYDSTDLQSVIKDAGITFFGPDGDMQVAKDSLEFRNLIARGYYCDPTVLRPISQGRVIFTPDAKDADLDMSILQRMAAGEYIRANEMMKLADYLQSEYIILDAKAQALVDSYTRSGNVFIPRVATATTDTFIASRIDDFKRSESADSKKPESGATKPPLPCTKEILRRPPGLDKKLEEMTGKNLSRSCCTDERLCENCTTILTHRKAALTTTTPPVLTDLMDAALNNFGESSDIPLPKQESSTADSSTDNVCPFDGREPGCRQIGCQLDHPSRQPTPEALNGLIDITHFPEKLSTNYAVMINLRNPNDGTISKQGTGYITHSHISTAGHVFKTRDKKKIPVEYLTVQFVGSTEQFSIDPNSIEIIPYDKNLPTYYSEEQVRFKLMDNMLLAKKTPAPIGVPSQVGEPIYIIVFRGKDNSVWVESSRIEKIENGLLYFRSNTQSGDSGAAVASGRHAGVIATYWGVSADPELNVAVANNAHQLPFYASGQKLKQNFSHPSLQVTSQWRGTF